MKKILTKTLILALALAMLLSGTGVLAATVTFMSEEQVVETVSPTGGSVSMPEAPSTKEGTFVGWYGVLNGEKFLLPAGAVLENVTDDLTVTAATVRFATNGTASLRIRDGDLGVRFTSTIVTEDYDLLVSYVGEKSIRFGTYIVPLYCLVSTGKKFNLERFKSYGFTKILDVPTDAFYAVDDKNGTSTIAGSVCNVLDENLTRDFCGCGYLKLTYTNGVETVVYADFNYVETFCSLTTVLFHAYEDRSDRYANLIKDKAHGAYDTHSNYTKAELDLMKARLDSIVSVSYKLTSPREYYMSYPVFKNGQYDYVSFKYYSSPWTIEVRYDDPRIDENTIIVTPKEGHAVSELKGVAFAGGYRSMTHKAEFVNGTFRFTHNEWS